MSHAFTPEERIGCLNVLFSELFDFADPNTTELLRRMSRVNYLDDAMALIMLSTQLDEATLGDIREALKVFYKPGKAPARIPKNPKKLSQSAFQAVMDGFKTDLMAFKIDIDDVFDIIRSRGASSEILRHVKSAIVVDEDDEIDDAYDEITWFRKIRVYYKGGVFKMVAIKHGGDDQRIVTTIGYDTPYINYRFNVEENDTWLTIMDNGHFAELTIPDAVKQVFNDFRKRHRIVKPKGS